MCDFAGFIVPEMVKVRPVVILSKHKHNRHLVTIVPLSTTEPTKLEDHHHELSTNPRLDDHFFFNDTTTTEIYTVALARLDRYQIGKNQFVTPTLAQSDFDAIRAGVVSSLNLAYSGPT